MTRIDALRAQIDDLEGEVMLAGFHGYSADHITPRLLKAYDDLAALIAQAEKAGKGE